MKFTALLRFSPIITFVLLLGLMAFRPEPLADSQAERGRDLYLKGIDSLAVAVEKFNQEIENLDSSPQAIQRASNAFVATRLKYKRIEFLVGYFDSQAESRLNGAPLQKVNESDLQRTIVEPEGFQVIEEILFGENPVEEKKKLVELSDRLRYRLKKMRTFAERVTITDRYLFEAMREEILRIAFLGLTGFDSPMLANSIPESEEGMRGVEDGVKLYLSLLRKESPSVATELQKQVEKGVEYIAAGHDFDSFDRLEFIRDYLNPLYAELLTAHYSLGYQTFAEASPYTRPVRYEVPSIFEVEAFDPFFYSPDPNDSRHDGRVELGRLLFFDPILSQNVRRSCASCHHPEKAFSDGLAKNLDISGAQNVGRNTPGLVNVPFQSKFFWDGRTEHLEHQIENVLLNHSEMRMTFEEIIERLRQSSSYREMFADAYRGMSDTAITKYAVTRALGSYMRTLVGMNSRFDQYVRGDLQEIDPAVKRGFNLFMGKASCGTCHFAPLFSGVVPPKYLETETEVLGVPATPDTLHPTLDADLGRFDIHHDQLYKHSFKTVTVRNVELTAPYMHNGVFKTLEEVVDFYDRGGGAGLGFNLPNQTLPADRLNLTSEEKRDLIAFMRSLTDTVGTTTGPGQLPQFPKTTEWNQRRVGGEY
ncbi:MAG: cytochrome c peroxidase [Candidatus Kapaibacterium sp.]